MVYARHGRELMGCKFSVRSPCSRSDTLAEVLAEGKGGIVRNRLKEAEHPLSGYGPIGFVNRLVRRRLMVSGGGLGDKPPRPLDLAALLIAGVVFVAGSS